MTFYRCRERYISIDEMNKHLNYVFKNYNIVYRDKLSNETFKRTAFIHDALVNFKLTYKKGSFVCTYICRKDGNETMQQINGGEAFRILSRYYKVPKMTKEVIGRNICGKKNDGGMSASPLIWTNPNYENQWIEAYEYDLNSAYSSAMLGPIPDTSKPMRSGIISPGEIGFEEVLDPKNPLLTILKTKYSGYSLYIFPLMESPFKKFVETWYNKKISSIPGSREHSKAKGVLNYSVGQMQSVNPFIRATIVCRCNEAIESLIDDYTLFCNTDSIVSLKPLNLKLGNGIGEWKLEHYGKVAYKGCNYQWENGEISVRGVPNAWFPKNWDITKDKFPTRGNLYEFRQGKLVKSENI